MSSSVIAGLAEVVFVVFTVLAAAGFSDTFFSVGLSDICAAQNSHSVFPNDTLVVYQAKTIPAIDGEGNDRCWESVSWQPIDQPWIPYGNSIGGDDYSGEYKILWSKKTNLLYFMVKITDDFFVDGYHYDSDPKKGDFYYNFDLLEVFIDEDRSGGMHVFDGDGEGAKEWGSCSANAFSYHMILDCPKENGTAKKFVACDLAGKSWENYTIADYADHFGAFAMHKHGNEYLWEFSLKVYDDSYVDSFKERSLVSLVPDKIMGISLAYCDNDDQREVPKTRDNFFGSVAVPEKAQNDHWKNADLYRVMKLSGKMK
jgi:hypothetical protein